VIDISTAGIPPQDLPLWIGKNSTGWDRPDGEEYGGSPLRTTMSDSPDRSNSPRMIHSPRSRTIRFRFGASTSSDSGSLASVSAILPHRKNCHSRMGLAHSAFQAAATAASRALLAKRAIRMRLASASMPPSIHAGNQDPPGLLIEESRISKSYGPSPSCRASPTRRQSALRSSCDSACAYSRR